MKLVLSFVCLFPWIVNAQEKGIKFEKDLTWQQVLSKARDQNKYVFIDCYATWCGPCKTMDKEIYTLATVGATFNDKFISVKVQMDVTKRDNKSVQQWYADASSIMNEFNVEAFPTYLFFSPEGKIIHRDIGVKSEEEFIALANAAIDPGKQYYRMLDEFKSGKSDTSFLRQLAISALNAKDKEAANLILDRYLNAVVEEKLYTQDVIKFLSRFNANPRVIKIAENYKKKHLDKLDENLLFTRENIDFVVKFSFLESKDGFFKLFYNKPDEIDRLMNNKGLASNVVKYVITKEEIDPVLWKDLDNSVPIKTSPDWRKLIRTISTKYNASYAKSLVLSNRLSFYKRIGNWVKFAELRTKQIKKTPPKVGLGVFDDQSVSKLNIDAWDAFLNCNDKNVLNKALRWSELSIKMETPLNTQFLDTRANLLYKLGRVQNAIDQEQSAIDLMIDDCKKGRCGSTRIYRHISTGY